MSAAPVAIHELSAKCSRITSGCVLEMPAVEYGCTARALQEVGELELRLCFLYVRWQTDVRVLMQKLL